MLVAVLTILFSFGSTWAEASSGRTAALEHLRLQLEFADPTLTVERVDAELSDYWNLSHSEAFGLVSAAAALRKTLAARGLPLADQPLYAVQKRATDHLALAIQHHINLYRSDDCMEFLHVGSRRPPPANDQLR